LYPGHTWFLQLPIFASSLVAIAAVWWMLRQFALPKAVPYLGALVLATSPIVTMYSTHIKQYNFDIVFASVLLVLAERWRQHHRARTMYLIGGLSAFAILFSGSSYVVVVPLFVVAFHHALLERARLKSVVLAGVGAALVLTLDYMVWLRHLAHGMILGWTARGFLVDYSTWHTRAFSIQTMGTQFLNYMVSLGTGHAPDPAHRVTNLGLTIASVFFLALAAIVGRWLLPVLRWPTRPLGVGATAALTMTLAVAMAFARHDPFGGGRTDEILYPSFLLLVGLVVAAGWARVSRPALVRGGHMLVAVVIVCLSWMGWDHRTDYPGNALRTAVQKMNHLRQPGDVVVVDCWMSFTWMADGLPHAALSRDPSFYPWSQGFHITSTGNNVLFSENYFMPSWTYPYISKWTKRVWYVDERSGGTWPSASTTDPIIYTRNLTWFMQHGWVRTPTTIWGPHVAIMLLEYQGTTPTR
jgi:hypothetical protein